MEYKEFAKYYDLFYQNKDYQKEVDFLREFLKPGESILDVGCGTGVHGSILESYSFVVDGVDLNSPMIQIARGRIHGELYVQNMLDLNLSKKYDFIISMFAVINHLKDTKELERCLISFKKHLNPSGRILIDLHNPQKSGEKTETYQNCSRTMKWNYDKESKIEKSDITFKVDNHIYKDSHVFRIFSIEEVMNVCLKVGLKVEKVFENYDSSIEGGSTSKNLQFLIGVE